MATHAGQTFGDIVIELAIRTAVMLKSRLS